MAFCKGKAPNYVCPVCGEPISRPGTHDACKEAMSGKLGPASMCVALAKLERNVRKNMIVKVKHWTKSMGEDSLREMFPDMTETPRER